MPMPLRACHIPVIAILSLAGSALGGCASINEKMSASMGDYMPQWAGGEPADAPPRPGTPKYDEYMRERERLRQMPAADRPQQPQTNQQAQGQQQGQQKGQSQGQQSQAQPSQVSSAPLDPVH
jgi:hypothetical protein